MDAIEFVNNYECYLDEISMVIKLELETVIIPNCPLELSDFGVYIFLVRFSNGHH